MRPPIVQEEVELLVRDLEMLSEQKLSGIEPFNALRLLEMRRQTAKLEFIKRTLLEISGKKR
ncbi:hypothetical protein HV127_24965 [Klebsiella sp. RHBSTW-00215]|uniref:hypothetical protein n=1 Tax=Klebsiella sp. RHBSTW-00215 TaxID=2742640 RepID=UPI0015F4ED19|nr:hypothetical protein [Klebsiella sp. RHBSTW-00215]MBA7934469.1 hypothetical protein [Klebsiella sp. RHBSTW-00215]